MSVATVAAALCGMGFVFPQHALFLAAFVGIVSIVVGLIAFTWDRVVRLALVAGGLAAALAGMVLLWHLQDHAAVKDAQTEIGARTAEISELLAKDHYLAAYEACERLQGMIQDKPEKYGSNEVRAQLESAKEELDRWLNAHYESLTNDGKQLLLSLLRSYPESQGVQGLRVRNLKVQGGEVSLSFVLASSSPKSPLLVRTNDPYANDARIVIMGIFESIPGVEKVVLTLMPKGEGSETTEAATYTVNKNQAVSLRMGEPPQRDQQGRR